MTGEQVAVLMAEWGPLVQPFFYRVAAPGSDGGQRAAPVLRRPWNATEAVTDAGNSGGLPEGDRPDFGIRFARGFVAACREGKVSRRLRRGLLRRQHGGLSWIRHAIRYLERTEGRAGYGAAALSPPQSAVAGALAIDLDPARRALLRRLLLSHGAEPEPVARVLELDVAAVAAWRALFFDVGDRTREPFRFFAALQLADQEDLQQGGAVGFPPLAECACLGFGMAVLHCGQILEGGGPDAAGFPSDAEEIMGYLLAWRSLLLDADACRLNARVGGDAIRKYNNVHGELRAQPVARFFAEEFRDAIGLSVSPDPGASDPDPDSELWPASVRLTLEDLRRMAGLWHQCAPPASPQRMADSRLRLPWRRPDEPALAAAGFPAEMSRPDFGGLLAKRVAAAGRSGELPAGGTFHWIRLMAAGLEMGAAAAEGGMADAEDAALRRAVELHASGSSRQLLQSALVTCDAEIGGVADFLGLDARVVDAYAVLFFNLPARRQDSSFIQNIESRIRAGLDPLDGGSVPPDRGLAEEMKAVPGITLDDLRRLLGFRAADSRAVDAADRLLGLLDRVSRRGQNQGAGRSVGKVPLESAVRLATRRINAHELGPASSLSGALSHPAFTRALEKANRESANAVRRRLRTDAGEVPTETEE